jgi:transposase
VDRSAYDAQAVALRARIVLAAAGQLTNGETAELEGISRARFTKWRGRFAAKRLEGLLDEPRPGQGRPRTMTDEQVERVVVTTPTLESKPKNTTHWSTRSMAKEHRVAADAVMRIYDAFGLQPHRQKTWTLSKDPQFIEKVDDICGLYLNPPERAVVLAVDEKSQIQALDRTAATLPMLPGTPERATHDYERYADLLDMPTSTSKSPQGGRSSARDRHNAGRSDLSFSGPSPEMNVPPRGGDTHVVSCWLGRDQIPAINGPVSRRRHRKAAGDRLLRPHKPRELPRPSVAPGVLGGRLVMPTAQAS